MIIQLLLDHGEIEISEKDQMFIDEFIKKQNAVVISININVIFLIKGFPYHTKSF